MYFFQSISVGGGRCLTLIRLPSNNSNPIHSTLLLPNRYIQNSPGPVNILKHTEAFYSIQFIPQLMLSVKGS